MTSPQERRGFIAKLVALSVSMGVPPTMAEAQARTFPSSQAQEDALVLTRFVNTLQGSVHRTEHRYLGWQALLQHPEFAGGVATFNEQRGISAMDLARAGAGGDLLTGFELSLFTTEGDYTVLVRERATGVTLKSDGQGVIRVGMVNASGTAPTPLLAAAFVGSPITHRRVAPQAQGPLVRWLQAVGSFFQPTLHAFRDCCGGECNPYQQSQCGGMCLPPGVCDNSVCDIYSGSVVCCNLGFEDCTWCCTPCGWQKCWTCQYYC
jgi:hypothetical protein